MIEKINEEAEYLLEDLTFEHDGAHLAYTTGTGAASGMNEAYVLKTEDIELDPESQELIEEIIHKAEGDLPNSAFAYVPDKDKTSTRKLRIDDANHVRSAVAALGKGMMGNKVQIPEKDLPAVKAKVRAAYKKFFPENEVPSVLKSMGEKDSDAVSESSIQKADHGINKEENTVTDTVSINKADHEDMIKKLALLESYQEKEKQELRKSKEDVVKSATFVDNQEEVVTAILADKTGVVESVIVKAVEAIEALNQEHKENLEKALEESKQEVTKAKEEAEATKEEFAKSEAIEGDNNSKEDHEADINKSKAFTEFLKNDYLKNK